jgi:CRP/FNR family cyclic AMP-dependent transcriptional regulator
MLGSKIELLERLPIFTGLSQKQLGSIAGVSEKAYFLAGENLIAKDEPGDRAYVIMTGTARCLHFPGAPASADQIGPGMLVGELAMLVDTVHALTVRAKDRVRAIALRRDDLARVMERDPAIAQQIAGNLLTRLQDLGRDMRKVNDFLARVETAAGEYRIAALDGAGAAPFAHLTPFPSILEQKTRRSG